MTDGAINRESPAYFLRRGNAAGFFGSAPAGDTAFVLFLPWVLLAGPAFAGNFLKISVLTSTWPEGTENGHLGMFSP